SRKSKKIRTRRRKKDVNRSRRSKHGRYPSNTRLRAKRVNDRRTIVSRRISSRCPCRKSENARARRWCPFLGELAASHRCVALALIRAKRPRCDVPPVRKFHAFSLVDPGRPVGTAIATF